MTDDTREQPRPPRLKWANGCDNGVRYCIDRNGRIMDREGCILSNDAEIGKDLPRAVIIAEPLDTEALAKEIWDRLYYFDTLHDDDETAIRWIRALLEKHL